MGLGDRNGGLGEDRFRERERGEAVGLKYIAWVWGCGLELSIMQLIYM